MIKQLNNKDPELSKQIRIVFQASYAVEAKLLKAIDFPPLKRSLESYIKSDNDFYGFVDKEKLAAVIEINTNKKVTHIQSLVVHPIFFRQGIARKLMVFVLNHYTTKTFMVETGVDNEPASILYKKMDFKEVKQWDTPFGIRKIRFEKRTNE